MGLMDTYYKEIERLKSSEECKKMLDEIDDPVIKDKVKTMLGVVFVKGFSCGVGAALRDEYEAENEDNIEEDVDDNDCHIMYDY